MALAMSLVNGIGVLMPEKTRPQIWEATGTGVPMVIGAAAKCTCTPGI